MLIQEITKQDSLDRLAQMNLGRLACAQGAQPYVAPFYFAYDSNYLYGFSTVGQRIEWMRANPLVCIETDELASSEEWVSIIVFGRYEELPNTPEWKAKRELAWALIQQKPAWWEPGYAKTIVEGAERPLAPVYFRIEIVEITGRRGTPDAARGTDANTNQSASS